MIRQCLPFSFCLQPFNLGQSFNDAYGACLFYFKNVNSAGI